MTDLTAWLLAADPWVERAARVELLGEPPGSPAVVAAHAATLAHPLVRGLLESAGAWPGPVLTSHKSAGHPLHQLTFLADIGLTAADAPFSSALERVLAHQSAEGPFQVLSNTPAHFGGSGRDEWTWALCDAPLLITALARAGLGDDPRVRQAAGYLAGLVRNNGWPCAVSPAMGRFRGPGRKDDPCPYATLAMLEALNALPEWRDSAPAHAGAEALLGLWAARRDRHPYLFHMGTDFCKLKGPLVWYDLLHVLDALSRWPWLRGDPRLADMAGLLAAKADAGGHYTAESVWTAWKGWDFGQKKAPSPWLTLRAHLILRRIRG